MTENPLFAVLDQYPEYVRLRETLSSAGGPVSIFGLGEAHKAHLLSALHGREAHTMLVVSANENAAAKMTELLSDYGETVHFPARELPLAGRGVVASDAIAARRIGTLTRLAAGEPLLIVASLPALMQRIAPMEAVRETTLLLELGASIDPMELLRSLVRAGYQREEACEGHGQVCLRGG